MLATENNTLTGYKIPNASHNVKLEKKKKQKSYAHPFEGNGMNETKYIPIEDAPELDYAGINSRLAQVFNCMIAELERRNRTWPELLEEYDHLKQKNAMLQKDKDHFFHEMHEWKTMYKNIDAWRKFAFEALLALPANYQALFIQKLHEIEGKDRDIQDRRIKELFANE